MVRMRRTSTVGILLLCIFLGACSFPWSREVSTDTAKTGGAFSGATIALRLLNTSPSTAASRSSSLLGIFTTQFLMGPAQKQVTAATVGIEAGITLLHEDALSADATYQLLEQLNALLETDVIAILDASDDKAATLAAYVTNLTDAQARMQTELIAVSQRRDIARQDARTKRSAVTSIQRTLTAAIRAKDFSLASIKQEELLKAQGESTVATNQEKQLRQTETLIENLLKTTQERLDAIEKNKEALLAGVQVTDVPGADDLGVLKGGRRRPGGSNLFEGI